RQWSLTASSSLVNDEIFPRVHGSFDHAVLLPLEHSSVWFRGAAGKSWGDRTNAFSNFFFGAFGNNWIDYQEVRRYRDFYSFPGVEINELGGNDFAKATAEWTLPPVRFRKMGVPALYSNWMRLALFSSALVTDVTKSALRQDAYNVGGQLDFSIVVFSNLDATFSVGYARAFLEQGRSSDEVMVSLKLLR
ncbi:MAG TPA: hypothetical protein VFL80_11590, partial [Thermoanaerobaculia bacterium]|nr:hypothetical protein [Thermoanaerobaculia bacterium]